MAGAGTEGHQDSGDVTPPRGPPARPVIMACGVRTASALVGVAPDLIAREDDAYFWPNCSRGRRACVRGHSRKCKVDEPADQEAAGDARQLAGPPRRLARHSHDISIYDYFITNCHLRSMTFGSVKEHRKY